MKCVYQVLQKNRKAVCRRDCNFILCKEHWRKFLKSKLFIVPASIVGVAGFIFTWYGNYKTVKEASISEDAKFQQAKYITGIYDPGLSSQKEIYFSMAGMQMAFPMDNLKKGVTIRLNVDPPFRFSCTERPESTPIIISFKVVDNVVKLSAVIKNDSKNIIGELSENRWKLITSEIANRIDKPHFFQVIDTKGYIPLSLKLEHGNNIDIKGYFITDSCTLIVNEGSLMLSNFQKNYKEDFEQSVPKKTSPLFNED